MICHDFTYPLGGPWDTIWEEKGCLFCIGFLHRQMIKMYYAFGGAGGRGGACLSLQILQSLHKDSITPCSPSAGVRRI